METEQVNNSNERTATGYHYPPEFQYFLQEMYDNESWEKQKNNPREEEQPDDYDQTCNLLWAKLIKDQKRKDNFIMSNVWQLERDEKLFQKSKLVKLMDEEFLPTFAKACLVSVKAGRDAELHGDLKRYNPQLMLAEALWNLNPEYPERQESWTTLENIPLLSQYLKPPEQEVDEVIKKDEAEAATRIQAATKIQAVFRGYLTRKSPEVRELRAFWEITKIADFMKYKSDKDTLGRSPKWKKIKKYYTPRELAEKKFKIKLKRIKTK